LHEPFDRPFVDDPALAQKLTSLAHQSAGRATDPAERAWVASLYATAADHPFPQVRALVASRCSLGLLRELITDADPYVRWAATFNPFVVDADVQAQLAADPDSRVVCQLVDNHDVGIPACRTIIASGHTDAKVRLAHRSLQPFLLSLLAADPDPQIRRPAQRRLAARAAHTNSTAVEAA
jgi:hypothetical protein